MDIAKLIRIVGACLFLSYVLTADQIVKRFDKTFFLKLMRIFSLLILVDLLVLSCIELVGIFEYAGKLFETRELEISELVSFILGLFIVIVTILYWKSLWYYIRVDNDTILLGWYIKKHLDLNKKREFEESYHCLQKASEIKPDSVHIWCMLASFSQLFLKNAEQADQYLAKARKILDSKSLENPKEVAIVECYSGYILQHRNDYQKAIEHMKKAYELDPRRFRKKEYEKALEMSKQARKLEAGDSHLISL